jgi:NADPH:quinone reductase-like Zn-dependent oxidoreductase
VNMMQRWELSAFGLEHLSLTSVPRPVPGPNEVLVEVEAVSLNYRDLLIIKNRMGTGYGVPLVPCSDLSGTVIESGANVTRFRVGDRVIDNDIAGWIDGPAPTFETNTAAVIGRLSRYVVADPEQLVRAPGTLSATEASTLPCAGLTAWMAIVELGHVHAGQTVVVQGTGGVAMFAIRLAIAHGARCIVTTSSEEKAVRLRQFGTVEIINRSITPEWQLEVHKLTGPRGADHIVEMAGGENIGRSLQAIALGGRISMVGLLGDTQLAGPTGLMLYKRATLAGIGVGPRRALEDLVRAVDILRFKPVIDGVYTFDQVPAAFEHLERGAFGKIVVKLS